MPTRPNHFDNVIAANAHFPWNHPPQFFCKCTSCHSYRQRRIHSKCDLIETAIDILNIDAHTLEWPTPAADLPQSIFATSLTPTTFARPNAAREAV